MQVFFYLRVSAACSPIVSTGETALTFDEIGKVPPYFVTVSLPSEGVGHSGTMKSSQLNIRP